MNPLDPTEYAKARLVELLMHTVGRSKPIKQRMLYRNQLNAMTLEQLKKVHEQEIGDLIP